ncbi:MAG: aldehyde dehydrogenase family protein [Desulfotignum sp.]|nr:aldehyde dehydrogenase family protein [Desulfotignum sp.]
MIIKPASTTPLSCLHFIDLLYKAGLPKAYCQALITTREDAEKLVSDKRISFLTFIGSGKVGWRLRAMVAPGVHCALEHGGAAPVIVEKDADLDKMIPALLKGGYYHAGQVCVSVQRVFVQQAIADEVMVNDHTAFRVDWMPFGGAEHSGLGTGGIGYSIKEMTREKLIVLNLS